MLWEQWINVYTEHKNLTRDGLGLTSDRGVTRLRILLEEYAPEIIYIKIKGIHNTVADAISRLDYVPKLNSTNKYNHATATHVRSAKKEANQKWSMCLKFWSRYNEKQGNNDECITIQLNQCFANQCSPRSKSLFLNPCSPRSKSLSLNIE